MSDQSLLELEANGTLTLTNVVVACREFAKNKNHSIGEEIFGYLYEKDSPYRFNRVLRQSYDRFVKADLIQLRSQGSYYDKRVDRIKQTLEATIAVLGMCETEQERKDEVKIAMDEVSNAKLPTVVKAKHGLDVLVNKMEQLSEHIPTNPVAEVANAAIEESGEEAVSKEYIAKVIKEGQESKPTTTVTDLKDIKITVPETAEVQAKA